MKLDIEQQLKTKRDALDIEEPSKALWNNIRAEWQKPKAPGIQISWWKVAAVLFLVSSIGLLIQNIVLKQEVTELASLGDISTEYREIETQYEREINQLTSNLPLDQLLINKEYDWVKEELQMLEEINKQYRMDIGKTIDEDRLVHALMDYYEKKIRILRKLQLEINRQQNEKDQSTPSHTI